jgi:hypothetical protein
MKNGPQIIGDKAGAENLVTLQELSYKMEECVFLNRFGIVSTTYL